MLFENLLQRLQWGQGLTLAGNGRWTRYSGYLSWYHAHKYLKYKGYRVYATSRPRFLHEEWVLQVDEAWADLFETECAVGQPHIMVPKRTNEAFIHMTREEKDDFVGA